MATLRHFSPERKRKAAASIILMTICKSKENSRVKRGKTREWIRRRAEKGCFNNIISELRIEDCASYKEMMRMSHEQFSEILAGIEQTITKRQVTGGHQVIKPAERLALTIRFLATGETFRSLSFQFRIGRATISYIVREVCQAIFKKFQGEHMRAPSSVAEWKEIAEKFDEQWQFPNCLGAVDGKHVVLLPPPGSGSHFFNYKKTHSIVLMAVAGPDYECLYANVGTNGRVSDGGVWNNSELLQALTQESVSTPPPQPLPFGKTEVPFVFLGDDAFALKGFLMKPYPQRDLTVDKRVYNYRHSRARRLVENLFGILANRWRVFMGAIALDPDYVTDICLATLVLHNFLRRSQSRSIYCSGNLCDQEDRETGEIIPGAWRQEVSTAFESLKVDQFGHNSTSYAKNVRDTFKDYFVSEGAVPWQWDKCL